ncbi:MAG: AAA family ATPase, partial [Bacteroidota bacterium]
FFSYPSVNAPRFERAINQMKKEIRRSFKGFELERKTMDDLFWYLFNPELTYQTYHLDLVVGAQLIKGEFGAAHFFLKDHCFVVLPAFDNYLFIASPNEKGKYNLHLDVEAVITKKIRDHNKVSNDKFYFEDYLAPKGAFLTEVTLGVNIDNAAFAFEEDPLDAFFARMGGNFEFSGEVEIERVGSNLNEKYPTDLTRAYFVEDNVKRLSSIIYGTDNTPLVIVGEEGVGKRSLIQETIFRYCEAHSKEREERLERVWHIDPTRIISGMSIVGMWQKRFESILRFVINRREKFDRRTDKILIDNVIAMLRIGKSSQNDMTLADVLKPFLEKRQLQLVLIATPQEWKIIQEKDRRFADLFQVIRHQEPSVETAVKMVVEQRKHLELDNDCQITTLAITQLFAIQRNYLRRKALPGSVMKLLRQLAVKFKGGFIDAPEVRTEFEHYSGIHQEIFDENYKFQKREVRTAIANQLIGQPDAVEALSDVIHLIKSKLNNPDKPLSSFLFIGPTGVGKTQAAKVLTNYLMGQEEAMIRFDMNEFIDDYAVQRLIGDYHNPEGLLTGQVRYRPFGVLLFDEIEKANPKVHDLLLQVLDDGRLTDSVGRTVDFTNMIVIMTSNVGARDAASQVGYSITNESEAAVYRKAVERSFRPEFINRIDQIVIFNPLEIEHILNIAHLQIRELLSRDGFVRRTTILNISGEALEWVARRGFDARMGGRALKRQIERDLTTLSAQQLVGTYTERPIIFDILLKEDKLEPQITSLEFIEPLEEGWLPEFMNERQGRKFYGNMLRKIERLEDQVVGPQDEEMSYGSGSPYIDTSDSNSLDWQFYWFKDVLVEFKESVRRKILGFGHDILEEAPVIPLRLKRVKTASLIITNENSRSKERDVLRDKLFQEDGLAEIRDMYQFEQAHFDKMQSGFINDLLDMELLQLFSKGFKHKQVDQILIRFQSAINNQGEQEIKNLSRVFEDLLMSLELQFGVRRDYSIQVEGHSMIELFEGETGYHLFHRPHKNPLPILITLEDQATGRLIRKDHIIRVYDGQGTITDVRTGFTIDGKMTPNEYKMLLYGGLIYPS